MRHGWSLVLALSAAGPALAQARTAAVYPIFGEGVSAAECSDVEGTMQSALVRASRSGPFAPADPPLVDARCGAARDATPACLARLAGGGVILYGVARRAGLNISLTLSTIDARQTVLGPVKVAVDPLFDNPKVFESAFEQLAAAARPPPAAAVAAPAPVRPKAPAAAVEAEPPDPSRWMKRASLASGIGAVAVLAGGVAFGYLARKTNDDLNTKYLNHSLTTADASRYSQVRTYGNIANGLFVASGALAVAAITFWGLLPDENSGMGLSGHF